MTAFTGFVQTAHQFYIVRFLLGVAEASFLPGMIVYLTHWFRFSSRMAELAGCAQEVLDFEQVGLRIKTN